MNMKEVIAQNSALTVSITNAGVCRMSGDGDQHVGSKRASEASVCSSKRPRMASTVLNQMFQDVYNLPLLPSSRVHQLLQ